jgi:DNA-binding FrmR family transcriptional regulator
MSDQEHTEIVRRLRTVCESLSRIHALAEAGAPCELELRQIYAVQRELQALKIQILNRQINASKNIIRFSSSIDNRLAELNRLPDLYNILIK